MMRVGGGPEGVMRDQPDGGLDGEDGTGGNMGMVGR